MDPALPSAAGRFGDVASVDLANDPALAAVLDGSVPIIPTDPVRMLLIVAASFVFHGLVFWAAPVRRAKGELSVRMWVVSTVHAVNLAVAAAAYLVASRLERFHGPTQLLNGVAGTVDEWCSPVLAYSTGYFVWDTLVMLRYKELHDVGGTIHHFIIFPSLMLAFFSGVSPPMQLAFFVEEASTPFLNIRSIYRGVNERIYQVCGYLFAFFFFASRLVMGSYIYVSCVHVYLRYGAVMLPAWQKQGAFLWQLVMATLSRGLNLYWGALILRKLFRGGSAASTDSAKRPRPVANGKEH